MKWTLKVTLDIDPSWVADGFEATKERMEEAIQEAILPYAYNSEKEVSVTILSAPSKKAIRRAQGYKDQSGPLDSSQATLGSLRGSRKPTQRRIGHERRNQAFQRRKPPDYREGFRFPAPFAFRGGSRLCRRAVKQVLSDALNPYK